MPNTPKTNSGKSIKERLAVARQMTAQQQEERSGAHRSSRKRAASGAEKDAGKKGSKKSTGKTGAERVTKRSRRSENFVEKPREKAKRDNPWTLLSVPARIAIIAVAAVVACVAILYPVGQTYYQSMRNEQRLQAELDAVNSRNAVIEEQNKDLDTDEGVENQARKELGWTKKGESAATVENPGANPDSSMALPDQVASEEIHAPQTWYYTILDAVFMYSE